MRMRSIRHFPWPGKLAAAVLVLMLATLLTGCGLVEKAVEKLPEEPGPYDRALEGWTRQAVVKKDMSVVLEAYATLRSMAFQEAWVDRRAELLKMTTTERDCLLADLKRVSAKELNFFLSAYTGDRKWNDFSLPNSIWRVFLENERGQRLAPSEVRQLRNRTEAEAFFPYLGMWSEPYELRFDLEDPRAKDFQAERLTLVITSVLGDAVMCWRLGGETSPPSSETEK
jgi:hypothetical protein